MKVGFNARRLEGQRLGVGRYIEYLLKYWAPMLNGDEVMLYLREPLRSDDDFAERYPNRVLGPRLTGMTWEAVNLPRVANDVDVLFCPSYSRPPVFRRPTVVAIHSTNEAQAGTHPWSYRFTYSPLYRRSAHAADRVIVPSRSTLEDVQALYEVPAEKLVVIPQGVDAGFGRVEDEERLVAVRRKWLESDAPYVLFVGKLSQRRNVPILMQAFAEARSRGSLPHKLLLMGPNHLGQPISELAHDLGIADAFVQDDGRVESHSELAAVYSGADLYVNASAYEGFSITLVEALACGTPVVTVDRAALTEIAGDAAVLVSEPSVEELADAMLRVLGDESLRRDLSARGVERAKSFRWEDTARKTWDVIAEVAGGGASVKVVILAGGMGTRLAEETETRPKPMVEIGGAPILWHIMKAYDAHGFDEFLIALGYKGEIVKEYFLDYRIRSSDVTISLGDGSAQVYDGHREKWTVHLIDTGLDSHTGGRVKRLRDHIGDETFMLTYGDGVSDVDIGRLVEFHLAHGRLATVTAVRPPARFGGMTFDGDLVAEFTEKPQVGEGWINGGFFVLEPGVLDYVDGDDTVFELEPLERLAADGQLVAYRHEGFWQCMDTLRDVRFLEGLWQSGDVPWKVWV